MRSKHGFTDHKNRNLHGRGNPDAVFFKFGTGKKIFVIIPGLSVQSVMHSAEAVAEE